MTPLIDATEMYLRTVWELDEEGIPALRARLVERLGVSAPAVSETVARLVEEGLVRLDADRRVKLTDEGRHVAASVMRKHRLAERLLTDVIGLSWGQVHNEACRWEHVISDTVEARLIEVLGDPDTSPFGNPIPDGDANQVWSDLVTVADAAAAGVDGTIARISERLQVDEDVMRGLDEHGVRPGVTAQCRQDPDGVTPAAPHRSGRVDARHREARLDPGVVSNAAPASGGRPDHPPVSISHSHVLHLSGEGTTRQQVTAVIEGAGGGVARVPALQGEKPAAATLTVAFRATGPAHAGAVVDAVGGIEGVTVLEDIDVVLDRHAGGKLETIATSAVTDLDDLAYVYTPGVARPCLDIAEDPARAYDLTIKRNAVAVVSDGSAVLGLGDIGPLAAMPVMEGKAILLKDLAGVDAYPICLDEGDPDKLVDMIAALATGFGGINLEDISAPRCFEIEGKLRQRLDIPVFHDDQHGTAVVVTSRPC